MAMGVKLRAFSDTMSCTLLWQQYSAGNLKAPLENWYLSTCTA